MGPVVAGILRTATGTMRTAMAFILLELATSLIFFIPLDPVKGHKEAIAYASKINLNSEPDKSSPGKLEAPSSITFFQL